MDRNWAGWPSVFARAVGRQAHAGKDAWDATMEVPADFGKAWERTKGLQIQPIEVMIGQHKPAPRAPVVIATDASMQGWGYIIYDRETRQRLAHKQGTWAADDKRHIFLKELDVALRAVETYRKGGSSDAIDLVGDNIGVVWALRHGYTRSVTGQAMLDASGTALTQIRQVIAIPSADNPADRPSRLFPFICDESVDSPLDSRLWITVDRWEAGMVESSQPWSHMAPMDKVRLVRHDAPDADDDFDDRLTRIESEDAKDEGQQQQEEKSERAQEQQKMQECDPQQRAEQLANGRRRQKRVRA
jgi:hypothetical protein